MGCPNAHYIDPAVFAEERDALLFGQWAGLAVAADVPEAGDAKPITFMGMPLLLLRDRNDQVRGVPKHMPPPWNDFGRRTAQDRGCHPLPLSQLVLFNRR
jgi:hypothetical protein